MTRRVLLIVLISGAVPAECEAGFGSAAIKEVAEELMILIGRKAGTEAVELIVVRVTRVSAKYGEKEVLLALKKAGSLGLEAIERAVGKDAPNVVKILSRHGSEGLVVVERESAMRLIAKYGDEAGGVIVRHGELAEKMIAAHGSDAIAAASTLTKRRDILRLAMLADNEAIQATNGFPQLLKIIAKHGQRGLTFIWTHRRDLEDAVFLALFIRYCDDYIEGKRHFHGK